MRKFPLYNWQKLFQWKLGFHHETPCTCWLNWTSQIIYIATCFRLIKRTRNKAHSVYSSQVSIRDTPAKSTKIHSIHLHGRKIHLGKISIQKNPHVRNPSEKRSDKYIPSVYFRTRKRRISCARFLARELASVQCSITVTGAARINGSFPVSDRGGGLYAE